MLSWLGLPNNHLEREQRGPIEEGKGILIALASSTGVWKRDINKSTILVEHRHPKALSYGSVCVANMIITSWNDGLFLCS